MYIIFSYFGNIFRKLIKKRRIMIIGLKQHIENLFKNSKKFSDSDGNLDIPKILESIEKIDIDLIKILKDDKKAKKNFFTQIEDVFVLNQNRLIEFFTLNDYMKNNSYTSYTNKIGLIKKDSFIKKFDDVVLAWPHKDCVLEGGQTKDDEKNKETFYNEIISSDEITRLFEPKVLTNIKKYSKDGIEENPIIKDDDNLIIKGNNLIALHSLKKKYAGKVKLIYIDPPYNTGSDSFKYNDNFNHSTWLTFMKNRLEVAREFLSDDGVIFVQCDDNEQAYLKVLMDEVFKNTFVNCISVEMSPSSGVKRSHKEIKFIKNKEYLLIYKNEKINITPIYDKIENYDVNYDIFFDGTQLITLKQAIKNEFKTINLKDYDYILHDEKLYNFVIKNSHNIFRRHSPSKWAIENLVDNLLIFSKEDTSKSRSKVYKIYHPKNTQEFEILFNIHKKNGTIGYERLEPLEWKVINGDIVSLRGDLWLNYDSLMSNINDEGSIKFTNAKKPELLLFDIIKSTTNPNDLVMDFHLGSGTTCAVAHKMNRRYIGIEQMDYIEDVSVERLKKVIDGEQGGISKAVNWQGGGDFVYAELKQINNFKDCEIGSLNKNMQYLPIDEIEDETYGISKEEIIINKKFYGIDNE